MDGCVRAYGITNIRITPNGVPLTRGNVTVLTVGVDRFRCIVAGLSWECTGLS